MRTKVKCISTDGVFSRLEIGKWYEVEEFNARSGRTDQYIVYGLDNENNPLDSEYDVYEKSLFITLDEFRNNRLDELGI